MSKWIYMNIKGQGHPLTLVQGHSDSTLSKVFSLESAMPIEAKFRLVSSWDGGMKVCSNGPGHMTKMAAMPIYRKNIKKLVLWNQKADDLESSYAASSTRVLPSCSYDNSGLTLTYFYGKVRFVPYAFVWGEGKTMDFSETIVVYDTKVGRCSQINEYMKIYEYQRSKWLIFNIFKLLFLKVQMTKFYISVSSLQL